MPPTPIQAWFNLPLGGIARGWPLAVRRKKGAARPATAAVCRKWRRDNERTVMEVAVEDDEELLIFIPPVLRASNGEFKLFPGILIAIGNAAFTTQAAR
jgi:hypothetical protein